MLKRTNLFFLVAAGMMINIVKAENCRDIIIKVPNKYKVEGWLDKGRVTKVGTNTDGTTIYRASAYRILSLSAEADIKKMDGKSVAWVVSRSSPVNYEQKVAYFLDGKWNEGKSGYCKCKLTLNTTPIRRVCSKDNKDTPGEVIIN